MKNAGRRWFSHNDFKEVRHQSAPPGTREGEKMTCRGSASRSKADNQVQRTGRISGRADEVIE
jgi:hypothetical protein